LLQKKSVLQSGEETNLIYTFQKKLWPLCNGTPVLCFPPNFHFFDEVLAPIPPKVSLITFIKGKGNFDFWGVGPLYFPFKILPSPVFCAMEFTIRP